MKKKEKNPRNCFFNCFLSTKLHIFAQYYTIIFLSWLYNSFRRSKRKKYCSSIPASTENAPPPGYYVFVRASVGCRWKVVHLSFIFSNSFFPSLSWFLRSTVIRPLPSELRHQQEKSSKFSGVSKAATAGEMGFNLFPLHTTEHHVCSRFSFHCLKSVCCWGGCAVVSWVLARRGVENVSALTQSCRNH